MQCVTSPGYKLDYKFINHVYICIYFTVHFAGLPTASSFGGSTEKDLVDDSAELCQHVVLLLSGNIFQTHQECHTSHMNPWKMIVMTALNRTKISWTTGTRIFRTLKSDHLNIFVEDVTVGQQYMTVVSEQQRCQSLDIVLVLGVKTPGGKIFRTFNAVLVYMHISILNKIFQAHSEYV